MKRLPVWLTLFLCICTLVGWQLDAYFDNVLQYAKNGFFISCGLALGFTPIALYGIIVLAGPKRIWRNNTYTECAPYSSVDSTWLRWATTLFVVVLGSAIVFYRNVSWLVLPSIAAYGVAVSLYFGHLLMFRMQCSLLEYLALTSFFGLVAGLVTSTFGATKLGIYLTPVIAGWVSYAAVTGIVNAQLLQKNDTQSRLFYMTAALLDVASPPLFILGFLILFLSRQQPQFGMDYYSAWAYPFMITGAIGFLVNVGLSFKTLKLASALIRNSDSVNVSYVLNSADTETTPLLEPIESL